MASGSNNSALTSASKIQYLFSIYLVYNLIFKKLFNDFSINPILRVVIAKYSSYCASVIAISCYIN